jgi:SAM-dependent methyltransferase
VKAGIDQINLAASNPDFEFDALSEARNYRAALFRALQPFVVGKVLEVGAGIGQFSQQLLKHPGLVSLTAVEPDRRFHSRLSASVPSVDIVDGTAAAVTGPKSWDCIVSINVLEHIEKDYDELALYSQLLKPEGNLCLFVPARQEIYSTIDKDFGHFRRYSTHSLRVMLENAGFDAVICRYYNCIGYFTWWLNFKLLRRRHFSKASVLIFDRIIFPFGNWLESLFFKVPIGQSVLVIARPTCRTAPKSPPPSRV